MNPTTTLPATQKRPRYYEPIEAAIILRVDVRTIYRWLEAGELVGRKWGGLWRIPVEALEPTSQGAPQAA